MKSARVLAAFGIDARRFWLLVDLFDELSDRGEMLDQLGRDGVGLKVATWLYGAFACLIAIVLAAVRAPPGNYFSTFLVLTAFLLFTVLLSECGNSLVNPVEGLVLAHQPIDGATYTAAKLTHLARIVVYLALGINAVPAFAGLMLRGARWFYPLLHVTAMLAAGFVAALLCCSLYGWLMRLLPASRLKAAGQLAGTVPLLAMVWGQPLQNVIVRIHPRLPADPTMRWCPGAIACAAGLAIVVFGIRSLSADYLIRVSSIARGGSPKQARGSWLGAIAARWFGGQPGRAGYAFVSKLMRRDYHFRRQAAPMLAMTLCGFVPMLYRGWRVDPFSGAFTTMHLAPHVFGFVLMLTCALLPYGCDYKASWFFLAIPGRAFGPFARGAYAALFLPAVLVPQAALFALLCRAWGAPHAALFSAYSLAVAAIYLALELRLIGTVPFTKQPDARRGANMMGVMLAGGLAIAIAVGLQHILLFRSALVLLLATAALGAAAWFLTRGSLRAFEASMRYKLGLLSSECGGALFQEIEA